MTILKKHWSQILFFLIILTVFIFISILLSADCSFSSNKIGESINCFINKTKDLWASIGSIATAISLIIIYLQLRVTKKQILNANKPNLLMNESIFKIAFEKTEPLNIKSDNTKKYEYKISLLGEYQGITLTNVGLGTAKGIEVSWQYDKELVEERKADFFIFSSNIQNINYLSKDSFHSFYPPFEYLASIIQSEECFKASIYETETVFINANLLQKKLNTDERLKLELLYADIYGTKFKQEFIVKVLAITEIVELNTYYVKLVFAEK